MKNTIKIFILLLIFTLNSCDFRDDREKYADMLIKKVELYNSKNNKLPKNTSELGLKEFTDSPAFYQKENDSTYIVWYGLSLGESKTYKKVVKNNMSDLNQLIEIIKTVRLKITDETDVMYTRYDNARDLQKEIDNDLNELINGNMKKLEVFQSHFAPTTTFQEISLSNGWGEEYIVLADRFDSICNKMKDK